VETSAALYFITHDDCSQQAMESSVEKQSTWCLFQATLALHGECGDGVFAPDIVEG
jgi:hypothetical protein